MFFMDPRVQAIKLFRSHNSLCVALFGEPTQDYDGWIKNLPADDFFREIPPHLPLEEIIPVADIHGFLKTSTNVFPDLLAEPTGEPSTAKLKDICRKIAADTGIPQPRVERICRGLLRELAEQIRQGNSFRSPIVLGEALTGPEGTEPAMKLRVNPNFK